jgi:hypothetical protein
MRRAIILLCLLLPLSAVRADALSVRDVIELTKAGVGEDVLLSLIEVDRGIFPTDVATIKALKEAGVSEKVIGAMVRKGRTPIVQEEPSPAPAPIAEPEPPPPAQPPIVVIEHHDIQTIVPVAVPVFVPVAVRARPRSSTLDEGTQQLLNSAPLIPATAPIVPTGAPILPVAGPRCVTPKGTPWWQLGSIC